MILYFAILGTSICVSILAYYIHRPYPILQILKKHVFEAIKDVTFIHFWDDCVPEIYQPDATSRGAYSNPLRIYCKTHYAFDLDTIQKMMYKVFQSGSRIFYFGKISIVSMKFEIQNYDAIRYTLQEFRGKKKIEYLILIKRKKMCADELSSCPRSLISVSIAYRIKKF